jgi:hypothetical protein
LNRGMHEPGQGLLTKMPVCTTLAVPLSRLATLKLPRVCELCLYIHDDEGYYIWKKHVAVNANLSGLKLLQLGQTYRYIGHTIENEIIKILRSLPALETLVIDEEYLNSPYVSFFKAFVPRDTWWTSGVLCPRLDSLQIEGIDLAKQPKLLGVLKDIVHFRGSLDPLPHKGRVESLLEYLPFRLGSARGRKSRASTWSPLKSFTFYLHMIRKSTWSMSETSKWELVGRDGKFVCKSLLKLWDLHLPFDLNKSGLVTAIGMLRNMYVGVSTPCYASLYS